VTFGGYDTMAEDHTWALDLAGASWSMLDGAGPRPSARDRHSLVNDPTGGRMILFGGAPSESTDVGWFADTWMLSMDGNVWTELSVPGPGPAPRASHAAAFDDGGRRMLVHGGVSDAGELGDNWMLELAPAPRWVRLAPSGKGPPPGSGHFAAFDPSSHRFLVVVSPTSSSSVTADGVEVWALSTDGKPSWSRYCPVGTRPASADGVVWTGGNLFVTSQGSAWRFDPSSAACE
jgi:hypothetical protein